MHSVYDITEFDEQATSKQQALQNLRRVILIGDTGFIGQFERSAVLSGATSGEIENVEVQAYKDAEEV